MADLYFGQNTAFDLISTSHGRKRLKFVESFEVDPSHTNKRLWFFNSKEMLPVSIYEGVSGSFGYLETEEKYFLAMVMDQDPARVIINDDPGAYLEFSMLLNSRNERGVQRNAIFVKGARISGVPESLAPREEQHSRVGFLAKTRYKIKNGGIAYVRILAETPDPLVFTTPDDILYDNLAGKATLAQLPADVNIFDPLTERNWLAVYKNGLDISQESIDNPGAFSVGNTLGVGEIMFATPPAATDVWEFYIPYYVA
jgi:hypothetical protein